MNKRHALAGTLGETREYSGVYIRQVKRKLVKKWEKIDETTVLVRHIKDKEGNSVTDHVWFSFPNDEKSIKNLNEGDVINFTAVTKQYLKGYFGRNKRTHQETKMMYDYTLENANITKVKKKHKNY